MFRVVFIVSEGMVRGSCVFTLETGSTRVVGGCPGVVANFVVCFTWQFSHFFVILFKHRLDAGVHALGPLRRVQSSFAMQVNPEFTYRVEPDAWVFLCR